MMYNQESQKKVNSFPTDFMLTLAPTR